MRGSIYDLSGYPLFFLQAKVQHAWVKKHLSDQQSQEQDQHKLHTRGEYYRTIFFDRHCQVSSYCRLAARPVVFTDLMSKSLSMDRAERLKGHHHINIR